MREMHGSKAYFKGFPVVGHIGGEKNRGAVGAEGVESEDW